MALPSSGRIKLSDVNTELGLTSTTRVSISQASVRTLLGVSSGRIRLAADGYGKANGRPNIFHLVAPNSSTYYSTNGTTWNLVSNQQFPVIERDNLAWGNGIYVSLRRGFSQTGYQYSTDGINWTAGNLPSTYIWNSVAFGNGIFVALVYYNSGSGNVYATSTNGINWTQRTMPRNASWGGGVCFLNDRFFALPYSTDGTVSQNIRDIYTSTDGINWTLNANSIPASPSNGWWRPSYGNGKYIMTCLTNTNVYATSTDGITFNTATLPATDHFNIPVYGNGYWVITRYYNTSNQNYLYSTDGSTWYTGSFPYAQYLTNVTFRNNLWIASSGYYGVFFGQTRDEVYMSSNPSTGFTSQSTGTSFSGGPYANNGWKNIA